MQTGKVTEKYGLKRRLFRKIGSYRLNRKRKIWKKKLVNKNFS